MNSGLASHLFSQYDEYDDAVARAGTRPIRRRQLIRSDDETWNVRVRRLRLLVQFNQHLVSNLGGRDASENYVELACVRRDAKTSEMYDHQVHTD